MGVTGLWTVLEPAGRPVKLETLARKRLAVDASIWIYHFLKAVRDKEGNQLRNSHIVGFFRRIVKLLYHGISPVFVFDGGAPILKRQTIARRKERRAGRQEDAMRSAGRLLAIQVQRHLAETRPKADVAAPAADGRVENTEIDQNSVVYYEHLNKPELAKAHERAEKQRFRKRDQFDLPEMETSFEQMSAHGSDPRIMTREQLERHAEAFKTGQDINLYDFSNIDLDSQFFKTLPLPDQYNILNAARLRSRLRMGYDKEQLEAMFPNRLEFSKFQIERVKERNDLTQRLMNINGMNDIGGMRIASDQSREYVLVKNDSADGGYALGLINTSKYDGSAQEKPVVLDDDMPEQGGRSGESSSDEDEFEDVPIPGVNRLEARDLQRDGGEMLHAQVDESDVRLQQGLYDSLSKNKESRPLFHRFEDIAETIAAIESFAPRLEYSAHDYVEPEDQLPSPFRDTQAETQATNQARDPPTPAVESAMPGIALELDDDAWSPEDSLKANDTTPTGSNAISRDHVKDIAEDNGLIMDTSPTHGTAKSSLKSDEDGDARDESNRVTSPRAELRNDENLLIEDTGPVLDIESDHDTGTLGAGQFVPIVENQAATGDNLERVSVLQDSHIEQRITGPDQIGEVESGAQLKETLLSGTGLAREDDNHNGMAPLGNTDTSTISFPVSDVKLKSDLDLDEKASPKASTVIKHEPQEQFDAAEEAPENVIVEDQDEERLLRQIAQEADEYSRFSKEISTVARDYTQADYESNLRAIREQRRKDLRDADEVNQVMIKECQELLRLFGLPYITAPMEAEAQCAELVRLGLVDGIVTDDSDVFLFGGNRVYKNMFNNAKYVECYVFSDLEREFSLDRTKLIRLAYLLGSDYTEGLAKVGPVTALEILAEFPGDNGLSDFKEWWHRVQTGALRDSDLSSPARRKLSKLVTKAPMPSNFGSSDVADAYLHPVVDDSPEPFQWGVPDLDGLRSFLMSTIGWSVERTNEVLVPVIRDMHRKKSEGLQSNMPGMWKASGGSGAAAPRQRYQFTSTRMENAMRSFREKRSRVE